MNKEEFLKEQGYDIRQMLCFFSNYKNYKKLLNIDYTVADIIVDIPTEKEIQNFINKVYDIINKKNRV